MNGKYTIISLFAGGGGSSLGYKMAGFKELLAVEYDNNAIETLKINFDFDVWKKDITEIKDGEILKRCNIKKGELDILDGSPPCQGFSMAGKRKINDLRNNLYKSYIKILLDLEPKVFVMENVSGLIKGKMKGRFNEILKELKSLNYKVKCKLMNAKYYNVPQSRERIIFIGVRNDINIEPCFPKENNKIITVKEILKNCP
ncbi:MAG: DNA (cytosine-5-)-methyltransferase, partial [Acidobacteria bacterium]|nr:DNA (cytosine-5-)-methyltransferase [Acidobacteriota bacterium]